MLAVVWAYNLKTKQWILIVIITTLFKSSPCRVIPSEKEKPHLLSLAGTWRGSAAVRLQLLALPRSWCLIAGKWHKFWESYTVIEISSSLRASSVLCCIFSGLLFAGWFSPGAVGIGLSQRRRVGCNFWNVEMMILKRACCLLEHVQYVQNFGVVQDKNWRVSRISLASEDNYLWYTSVFLFFEAKQLIIFNLTESGCFAGEFSRMRKFYIPSLTLSCFSC